MKGQPMRIAECIKPECVVFDVDAVSKPKLLQTLSEKAGEFLGIDAAEILLALRNREKLGSTGIGAGIAIPHTPLKGLVSPFGLVARLKHPIEFEAIDEMPVDIVCLVLTPPEAEPGHLSLLSRIARKLRSAHALDRIRSATTSEQLYTAIAEGDA